jgi:hypothetical protein
MCTGLEIAGALTALAGAGASYAGVQQANSAMNKTVGDELAQTQALQKKATPIFQSNLKQATDQQAGQQGQQQALAEYQKVGALPVSTAPLVDAPSAQYVTQRTGADIARGQNANAALQQYPAQQTAWNVENTNTNSQLGNISAIGQSLASVFPAQLAQAGQAGASLQGVGSLLGTLGMLGGVYGATKVPTGSSTYVSGSYQPITSLDGTYGGGGSLRF